MYVSSEGKKESREICTVLWWNLTKKAKSIKGVSFTLSMGASPTLPSGRIFFHASINWVKGADASKENRGRGDGPGEGGTSSQLPNRGAKKGVYYYKW